MGGQGECSGRSREVGRRGAAASPRACAHNGHRMAQAQTFVGIGTSCAVLYIYIYIHVSINIVCMYVCMYVHMYICGKRG